MASRADQLPKIMTTASMTVDGRAPGGPPNGGGDTRGSGINRSSVFALRQYNWCSDIRYWL
ncbi:hypothetical protein ACSS6W_005024 [Trichoderma asperelloides]